MEKGVDNTVAMVKTIVIIGIIMKGCYCRRVVGCTTNHQACMVMLYPYAVYFVYFLFKFVILYYLVVLKLSYLFSFLINLSFDSVKVNMKDICN